MRVKAFQRTSRFLSETHCRRIYFGGKAVFPYIIHFAFFTAWIAYKTLSKVEVMRKSEGYLGATIYHSDNRIDPNVAKSGG